MSLCPFDMSPTFFSFLFFWTQQSVPDSSCIVLCPTLKAAFLVSVGEERCLGAKLWVFSVFVVTGIYYFRTLGR